MENGQKLLSTSFLASLWNALIKFSATSGKLIFWEILQWLENSSLAGPKGTLYGKLGEGGLPSGWGNHGHTLMIVFTIMRCEFYLVNIFYWGQCVSFTYTFPTVQKLCISRHQFGLQMILHDPCINHLVWNILFLLKLIEKSGFLICQIPHRKLSAFLLNSPF